MKSINELREMFGREYGFESINLKYYFTPGRVNLIGEHIDYNGGMVFPAALSMGVYGIMSPRKDNIIRLRSFNLNGEITTHLDKEIMYSEEVGWGNYPKGVIKYILEEGIKIKGYDILYYSDLPNSSGLSSSAALEVLTGYMLMDQGGIMEIDGVKLAKLCQEVENRFVGVNCGIMDQFSVAMGKKDHAILLNCNTLEYDYIPFILKTHSLVIINTNKKRGLTESKYNERREECERGLEIINKNRTNYLENLCKATLSEVNKMSGEEIIQRRVKHVVNENSRVLEAVKALRARKLDEFGRLMIMSHKSLQYDYEVTGLELDTIVNEAIKVKGCIGARMTGAGFGGCAIALVENNSLDLFKEQVGRNYNKITGLDPDFYVTAPGDGARRLS